MRNYFVFALALTLSIAKSQAQVDANKISPPNKLIQFSGIVMSADTLHVPIPYASVYNKSIRLGSVANYQGFFSFASRIGDTIEVTSVGYEKGTVIVPDIPDGESYTALVMLEPAIRSLPNTTIYPWFSKEQFRDAFIHIPIPNDAQATAEENLDKQKLQALGEYTPDANLSAMKTMQSYSGTYYYKGQYQPTPILSPSAWMQFFSMLKNGELKRESP